MGRKKTLTDEEPVGGSKWTVIPLLELGVWSRQQEATRKAEYLQKDAAPRLFPLGKRMKLWMAWQLQEGFRQDVTYVQQGPQDKQQIHPTPSSGMKVLLMSFLLLCKMDQNCLWPLQMKRCNFGPKWKAPSAHCPHSQTMERHLVLCEPWTFLQLLHP